MQGQHKVLLAYQGYTGEQGLTVDGNKKSQTLTIQVKLTNGAPWGLFVSVIVGLIVVIGVLLFIIFKRRKKEKA